MPQFEVSGRLHLPRFHKLRIECHVARHGTIILLASYVASLKPEAGSQSLVAWHSRAKMEALINIADYIPVPIHNLTSKPDGSLCCDLSLNPVLLGDLDTNWGAQWASCHRVSTRGTPISN